MHAKMYLFSDKAEAEGEVIVGSSNLTSAGLETNIELNMSNGNKLIYREAVNWYGKLWNQAKDFDLASLLKEIYEFKSPYEIFLRVLWELYHKDLTPGDDEETEDLTNFQYHGVIRALRLLDEHKGVIIADEVGLGKTFIAGHIIRRYNQRRQRVLVICPAALKRTWETHRDQYSLACEVVSYEALARDQKLYDKKRRPNSNSVNLSSELADYQLIVVDEAHNYRNPSAPQRGHTLRTLLKGHRKDLVLLSATPVNNSLWDLHTLISYFLRGDTALISKNIFSIKHQFAQAMRGEEYDSIPPLLYPILDATTIKRTRRFIKKYYANERIKTSEGEKEIIFPNPKAITIKYKLDEEMPEVYDLVEEYMDRERESCLTMARYKTEAYRKDYVNESKRERLNALTGLLISGLLKRFESSAQAFKKSLERMIAQHESFLSCLSQGHVIDTSYFEDTMEFSDDLQEYAVDDKGLKYTFYPKATDYDSERLEQDVNDDLSKLKKIHSKIDNILIEEVKYRRLVAELEKISKQAAAKSSELQCDSQKVIIFSYFADTAEQVHDMLEKELKNNSTLASYLDDGKPRLGLISGDDSKSKDKYALQFSPKTNGGSEKSDKIDILVSTDVLAEGVNLQQASNIINYDMPWNPMRLVQRHGRIDRIGNENETVYLRTFFPEDRLEGLLKLEQKIKRKISLAAASIGVTTPLAIATGREKSFNANAKEIEKLLKEDPSIFENFGTKSSTQSGEEYRQILREEKERLKHISKLPWKSGSVMKSTDVQGMFFLASCNDRLFPCFLETDGLWRPRKAMNEQGKQTDEILFNTDIGTCLNFIECGADEQTVESEKALKHAYDLWPKAQGYIKEICDSQSNPKAFQPSIARINREVADLIRKNEAALNMNQREIDQVLDIVETSWPRDLQDEMRQIYNSGKQNSEICRELVDFIKHSGQDSCPLPENLGKVDLEDINLIVWMALTVEEK